MTRNDILNYDKLNDIDTTRGQLLSILNHHQVGLSRTLTTSQERLSQALKQIAIPDKTA